MPEFQFQRFPYPPFVQDRLLPALISFISIFIIFSYTYSAVRTIKLVTVEKETQMKVSTYTNKCELFYANRQRFMGCFIGSHETDGTRKLDALDSMAD